MSAFYPGHDPLLKRRISLRPIPPGIDTLRYCEVATRARQLRHPNLLEVVLVRDDALAFEEVQGQLLTDHLKVGPGDRRQYIKSANNDFVVQMLAAVSTAHQFGLVHGRITPDWIWMFPKSTLKIWGFGLAEIESGGLPSHWLAPEQRRGQPATPRSDVWQLGALFHYLATGEHPALERRSLPENDFGLAVERCLCQDPESRFADGSVLQSFLMEGLPSWGREHALALHQVAHDHYNASRYTRALHYWAQALALCPLDLGLQNNLGLAHWRAGDLETGKFWLESASSYWNLALLAYEQQDFEGALYLLTAVTREHPHNSLAYRLGGLCHVGMERWDQAIEELQKSLIVNPQDAGPLELLGWVYLKKGRHAEAQAYRDKAAEASRPPLALKEVVIEPL